MNALAHAIDVRKRLRSLPAVPDTGITMRNGRPVVVPRPEPIPEPQPVPIRIICLCPKCGKIGPPEPPKEEMIAVPRVRVADILEAVCCGENISQVEILSDRRHAATIRARFMVMYLARHLTLRSYPEIGRILAGRDHTTVMNGVGRITKLRAMDPELDAKLDRYMEALRGQPA